MITDLDKKDINELIRKALCCAPSSAPTTAPTLQEVTTQGSTTTDDITLSTSEFNYMTLFTDPSGPYIYLQNTIAHRAALTALLLEFGNGTSVIDIAPPATFTTSHTITLPELTGTFGLMGADNVGNFTLDGALYLKPGTTDRYKISYDSGNAALRFDGNYTIFSNENGFASFFFRDAVNGIFMTMAGGAVGVGNFATNGYKFEVTGSTKSSGRFQQSLGAGVASANNLTLGTDGNVFHITGTTQINAITTASWSSGSEIILIFDSTPTVKNNTAGGAGTAKMLLAGGADFAATANDVLKLVYDGTSWFEVSRSVN